jgi:nucleoside-diphosphate-sugar epimerase
MNQPERNEQQIVGTDDVILVTGASGFIGSRVVENLIHREFRRIRCIVRPSSKKSVLAGLARQNALEILPGNLLSIQDCLAATEDVKAVIHLAAGRGEKSFPDAFMNTVVTTRNLLAACARHGCCRRFVNVSSFAVYTNTDKPHGRLLDEGCPIEKRPELRGEAYCFAKAKQEEIVSELCSKHGIPFVTLRPGVVYGPGNLAISGRVGVGTFGLFMHLGGSNRIPLSYVDNCAEAIVLAGLRPTDSGEVFNVVDDNLPTSRQFLKLYKANVKRFRSLYVPKAVSYALCYLWERYSSWSSGQLPPLFNRSRWNSLWRKTEYSNQKIRQRLGWTPVISTQDGLRHYFAACRAEKAHA